jgi:hypothetical protein
LLHDGGMFLSVFFAYDSEKTGGATQSTRMVDGMEIGYSRLEAHLENNLS